MRAGGLKERVIIQSKSVTADDIGFPAEGWSTVATVWADVRQERGNERLQANRETTQEYAVVFIRYRSDVSTKNRIQWANKNWDVESVRIVSQHKNNDGLELTVRAYE